MKDIELMGHLCFDWAVPSDHMLEKAKAESRGLNYLFLKKSHRHAGEKVHRAGNELPSTPRDCMF